MGYFDKVFGGVVDVVEDAARWVGENPIATLGIGAATGGVGGLLTGAIVGGTAAQYQAQKQAAQAQRRLATLQTMRQQRDILRASRIQRAQALAAGIGAGVGLSSSSVQGGLASLGTQTGGELSFLEQANALNLSAAKSQERAALYGQVSQLGMAAVSTGIKLV